MSESDIRGFLFSGPAYRSAHVGYASSPPCDLRAGLLRFARNDGGWRPWRHCEERMRRSNPVTACRSRRQWRNPDERKRHPGFSFLPAPHIAPLMRATHLLHYASPTRCHRIVMRGLVPRIHVLLSSRRTKDVDGRVEPGHDGADVARGNRKTIAQGMPECPAYLWRLHLCACTLRTQSCGSGQAPGIPCAL